MAYRDELEAARRRIQQLEAELAVLRGEEPEPAPEPTDAKQPGYSLLRRLADETKRRKALEARLTELTDERAPPDEPSRVAELSRLANDLRRKLQSSAERVAALEREVARPLSLWEHNRADPSLLAEGRSDVLCPICLGLGERVPMVVWAWPPGTHGASRQDEPHTRVVCPRCLYFGLRRSA